MDTLGHLQHATIDVTLKDSAKTRMLKPKTHASHSAAQLNHPQELLSVHIWPRNHLGASFCFDLRCGSCVHNLDIDDGDNCGPLGEKTFILNLDSSEGSSEYMFLLIGVKHPDFSQKGSSSTKSDRTIQKLNIHG